MYAFFSLFCLCLLVYVYNFELVVVPFIPPPPPPPACPSYVFSLLVTFFLFLQFCHLNMTKQYKYFTLQKVGQLHLPFFKSFQLLPRCQCGFWSWLALQGRKNNRKISHHSRLDNFQFSLLYRDLCARWLLAFWSWLDLQGRENNWKISHHSRLENFQFPLL